MTEGLCGHVVWDLASFTGALCGQPVSVAIAFRGSEVRRCQSCAARDIELLQLLGEDFDVQLPDDRVVRSFDGPVPL